MARTIKNKPRRRLEADAARELILDATEKRLADAGASGIRLQEVAADAGVSHSTVLHHFGSRELLVKAVVTRSIETINAHLVEAIQASAGDDADLEAMLDNVADALERTGHARVVLWLALEGHPVDGGEVQLHDVVDAAHALRLSRKRNAKKPTREDTGRTIVLATLALVSSSVLAPTLLANAGLPADARAGAEFRRWLARLLIAHLDK
jgi:AcrR family transcriptional regulator